MKWCLVGRCVCHGNCPAQSSLPVLAFLATSMYVVRNSPHNISLIHKLKKTLMARRFNDVTIQEQLQAALYCFKLTKKATPSIMANIFWAKNVLMKEMEYMFESMWHIYENSSIRWAYTCIHRHVWMKTGTVLQRYQPSNHGVLGLMCSEFYNKT